MDGEEGRKGEEREEELELHRRLSLRRVGNSLSQSEREEGGNLKSLNVADSSVEPGRKVGPAVTDGCPLSELKPADLGTD